MTLLEDSLFQELAVACSESRQVFHQSIGLSQSRVQLLTVLSETGEVTHAVLQQRLNLDGATVTRLVKQFEAEHTLSRRLDPKDNRYTLVSLTEEGKRLVSDLLEQHHRFEVRLLDGIGEEEQRIVLSALQRVRANIRAIEKTDLETED